MKSILFTVAAGVIGLCSVICLGALPQGVA